MKKNCKFCKDDLGVSKKLNPTINWENLHICTADLIGNHLEFNVTEDNVLDIYEGNIRINYCPMCGRALGREKDKREKIRIKYFSKDYPRLKKLEQGDWIDLRIDSAKSHTRWEPEVVDIDEYNGVELVEYWHDTPTPPKSEQIRYVAGDILFIGLGVAMELPKGYEAHIVPRSSTFGKTGWILTNGKGIIDNKYNGDDDEWKAMIYCTRDGVIGRHERLFQFRIVKNQPSIEFEEVEELGNENRGGYGSTDEKED